MVEIRRLGQGEARENLAAKFMELAKLGQLSREYLVICVLKPYFMARKNI